MGVFLIAILLAGCSSNPLPPDRVTGPNYEPTNVDKRTPKFPAEVKRLVVLPVTSEPQAADGVEGMEQVLYTELVKSKLLEVVRVSPAQMERWTGKATWAAEDKLPGNFFTRLRDEVGCDAVLFARLTAYHPYPPVTVGWRMKMLTAKDPVTLWAVDELLDARNPRVVNGARRYQMASKEGSPDTDSRSILLSPSDFGHYAASLLIGTMPSR